MPKVTVTIDLPEDYNSNITLLALTLAGANMENTGKDPKAFDDAHEIIKQIQEQTEKS